MLFFIEKLGAFISFPLWFSHNDRECIGASVPKVSADTIVVKFPDYYSMWRHRPLSRGTLLFSYTFPGTSQLYILLHWLLK